MSAPTPMRGSRRWGVGAAAVSLAVSAAVTLAAPAGGATKPPPTKPGVPSIISVKAAPLSAIVTFTKPAHDGGAPVRSDLVTCTSSNGGVKAIQNGPRSPIAVRGMSVGKSYTCRVQARNRIGISNPSAPSGVVIPLAKPLPAVPGAPTITYVHPGPQSLAVGFTPPSDHGGAVITTYRAKCASGNGGHPGAKEFIKSPVILDQLSAGKAYTCTLQARNPGGYGPASNRSAAVTTMGPPKVRSVSGGERSVTVAFTVPKVKTAALIVSFQATCTSSDGGASGSQSAATSPIRVRNLSIGKRYTCRVAVRNGSGVAAISAPSSAVTTSAS